MADLEERIAEAGFTELPIRHRHTQVLDRVTLPHRDPFDRLLIAQSLTEGLTFLTADHVLLDASWPSVIDARE